MEKTMKKIKTLGLLAASALALVAFVGTPSASAAAFTTGGAGETFTSTMITDHIFELTGGQIECNTVEFKGSSTGASAAEITLTPVYDECVSFEFENEIEENTCEITLKAATTGEPGHATVSLHSCENKTVGMGFSIHVPFFATCIVDFPEQSISTATRYSNLEPGGGRVDITADSIMFDVTTSTGFCPLTTGTHSGANGGSYTGASEMDTPKGVHYSP
jgi:hypothetical protein